MNENLVLFYSKTGTTKRLAEKMGQQMQAKVIEIQVTPPMPIDMYETSDLAKWQRLNDKLPTINTIPSITDYKNIFIGGPVWSGVVATPILSLLKKHNFEGQHVIPFITSVGSFEGYAADFAAHLQAGAVNNNLITNIENSDLSPWMIKE